MKVIAVLLLATIYSVPVMSQAPSAGNLPDAHAIAQHASAAMGCNIITANTNVRVTGHIQVGTIPAPMPVTIDSQGNFRWRSELDTPKEHKVTIVNSGRGQIQHADGRVTHLSDDNSAHQRPMHIPCLTDIALPPGAIDATYLRTETVGADLLDVVEVLPVVRPTLKAAADRFKTLFWISHTSGYVAKLQYINAAEQDSNDARAVEVDYFDYRVIDGLAVPFHQITSSGTFSLDLLIDSVQLNAPAADFQLR